MTETEEQSRQRLRAKAGELRAHSEDLSKQFDHAKAGHEGQMRKLRFFSRDRSYFWKMPPWLWVPMVCLMAVLFLVALLVQR